MKLELKLKDILQDNPNSKYYLNEKQIQYIKENEKHKFNEGDIVSHCMQKRSANRPSIQKNKNSGGTGHLSKSDGTSYCLDTSNAQAIEKTNNTENKIRRLTPIECERLQGFPDNHTEGVSDSQRYKQMGNSITVNVMMAIIKNLI